MAQVKGQSHYGIISGSQEERRNHVADVLKRTAAAPHRLYIYTKTERSHRITNQPYHHHIYLIVVYHHHHHPAASSYIWRGFFLRTLRRPTDWMLLYDSQREFGGRTGALEFMQVSK